MTRGNALVQILCGLLLSATSQAQDIVEMVKRVKPAVVTVTAKNAFGLDDGEGSGFFISKNRIITCFHVVEGAAGVTVRLNDSTELTVKHILAKDSIADIAILELNGNAPARITPLQFIQKLPEQGERIYVVGNPLGLEQSVSDGIVSSVRDRKDEGQVIQFTAAISRGNSGSPLLDSKGMVYGVAKTVLEGGQNLNFACPASRVTALSTTTVIPFEPSTKKYGDEVLHVVDAFEIDTTLIGTPPEGALVIDRNLYRLRTAALRLQWDADIVDKNLTRLTRAIQRRYSELNIRTDTINMRQARAVVMESLGDNYDLSTHSPEEQAVVSGIRERLAYVGTRLLMKKSIAPIAGMTGILNHSGQIWVELDKDSDYLILGISDTSSIKDVDCAVFYRDVSNKWIAVASDTKTSAHPHASFTAPVTGEYAIVFRVAQLVEGIKRGGVGAIVLER